MSKKLMGIALAIVVFLGLSSVVSATTVTFLREKEGEPVGTMTDVHGRALNITVPAPTKDGYTFDAWATDNASVRLNNNTIRMSLSNFEPRTAIVYGTWTIVEYGIEYDLDGGEEQDPSNPNPTSYTAEDQVVEIANPTKEGYEFNGWLNDGGENLGKDFSFVPEVPYGDKTFTATWKKISEETPATTTETPKTTSNPKTGISTTKDIVLLIIGLISFIGLVIYNPKKSN